MSRSMRSMDQFKSRRTPLDWLRLWFLLRDPVGRRKYVASGFGLMVLKYSVECAVAWALTGLFYTPLDLE